MCLSEHFSIPNDVGVRASVLEIYLIVTRQGMYTSGKCCQLSALKKCSRREVEGKPKYFLSCPSGLISSCLPNITSLLLPFFNDNELSLKDPTKPTLVHVVE